VDIQQATRIVDAKDGRKHVAEQWDCWQLIATDWIDNDGDLPTFLTHLDRLLANARAAVTATDRRGA
jgi:hypothetical protein